MDVASTGHLVIPTRHVRLMPRRSRRHKTPPDTFETVAACATYLPGHCRRALPSPSVEQVADARCPASTPNGKRVHWYCRIALMILPHVQ
jgi:hypothetical protein